jgi:hypothetical protein
MAELVKIPFLITEFQAVFEPPHVAFIGRDWARAFEEVFTALSAFNFLLTHAEIVNTGRPADHKAIFRLPDRGMSFQFGAEGYRFSRESWAPVEDHGHILLAAERALMEGSTAKVASCRATVGLHIQPLNKSRDEILAPFISAPVKALMEKRPTRSYTTSLTFADGDAVIDFSMPFANGIFLRFSSVFNDRPPLPEILAKMSDNQAALFEVLGIEEETNA